MGVVQDWITLELAIRIHNAKGYTDISEAGKRKLRLARLILFTATALVFCAFSIAVAVSSHQPDNYRYAFFPNGCVLIDIIGFCFLCQVIVMISLVIWLFVET